MDRKKLFSSLTAIAGIIVSLAAVCGFRYEISFGFISLANTYSFIWLPLFVFFQWIFHKCVCESDKRILICAASAAFVISVFSVTGISLKNMNMLSWIWENVTYLRIMLNMLFAYFSLYFSIIYLLFRWLKNRSAAEVRHSSSFSGKRMMIWWLILMILYIPWYLTYYPGILSADSIAQIQDAVTTDTLSDHHSAFLDLVLRGILLPVRDLTGSLQPGVGICIFFQMMITTLAFACCYERIRRYLNNFLMRMIVFLWYSVFPVNPMLSVTLWKDIIFSVCFLFFFLCLEQALKDEDAFFTSGKKRAALLLLLTALPLFRHNGISVTFCMSVCMPAVFKKYRRQLAVICCLVFALAGIWKLLLTNVLNAAEIAPAHVYSVLEQQIVRVLDERRFELSEQELEELEAYFDVPEIWKYYDPLLSDPVKNHFRNEVFSADPQKFFSLWKNTGLRYPMVYLEAFLMNNYGYWFPEMNYYFPDYHNSGEAEIVGIHPSPILNFDLVNKVYDWILEYRFVEIPVFVLLFSPGACFWVWIICGFYCLYNNRRKFMLFLSGFSLWLGILVTPICNDFRYVYGLFIALPLLLASVSAGPREE